jgi:hypothetical protein
MRQNKSFKILQYPPNQWPSSAFCPLRSGEFVMRSLYLAGLLVPAYLFALFPAVNAQAGLLDLFNQSAPEPPSTVTVERPTHTELPPIHPLPEYHLEPRRHITVVHKNIPDKAAALGRQSAALMKDNTLRDGDAIMTQNGIRVFAGSSLDANRTDEFVTLAETNGLSPAERTALAEIDAHRSEEGWQSKSTGHEQLITGRSAVNTAHAWKWLRDPKGHLVRYVGP